jgi:hypothetical protein
MPRIRRDTYVFSLSLVFVLLSAGTLYAAEDQPAPQPPDTMQETESLGASDPLEIDLAEEAARESFDTFTIAWMRKLTKIDRHKEKVTETEGSFSVEYLKYLPTRYTVVKKTKSEQTPFVGILTYYRRQFHSTGTTEEEAQEGPFEELKTKQVSEIFRYTKGKWVY